jgi:hypothetical protein
MLPLECAILSLSKYGYLALPTRLFIGSDAHHRYIITGHRDPWDGRPVQIFPNRLTREPWFEITV